MNRRKGPKGETKNAYDDELQLFLCVEVGEGFGHLETVGVVETLLHGRE